jgi:hypothetical protein
MRKGGKRKTRSKERLALKLIRMSRSKTRKTVMHARDEEGAKPPRNLFMIQRFLKENEGASHDSLH